jgi:hypothetical protein
MHEKASGVQGKISYSNRDFLGEQCWSGWPGHPKKGATVPRAKIRRGVPKGWLMWSLWRIVHMFCNSINNTREYYYTRSVMNMTSCINTIYTSKKNWVGSDFSQHLLERR